jgi:hypothetical protein
MIFANNIYFPRYVVALAIRIPRMHNVRGGIET